MIIKLSLDPFLYELFPTEANNIEQLKSNLKTYYTLGPFEPKIEISESEIIITVDPNKNNYSIPSIKDKTFTGYQTLAYYYTSWALAMPDQLVQLKMPFDKEFALAHKIIKL